MATTLLNTSHNVYSAGGESDAYTFYFGLTLDSQDTPGNQSSFTATWGAKGNYGYAYSNFSGLGVTLYISTDGSNWESLGYTGVSKVTTTQATYASKPFTKGHNNDGSLTIYYRAVYNGGTTSWVPRADTYTSGALSVTKIPRASTLNVATTCNVNNSTGSLAVSVTKAYSGYYDRFSYSIGSVSGRVVNLGTGTSGSIPYSTILNALPATAVATLKIALATYSDSGYTSLIGRSEKEVAVTIDISAIKPSITINEHCVVNTTNIAGYCFAGFGTLRAKFTSNLSYGASSVSTKYTISYGQLETTSSTGTSQVTVKSLTMPTQSTNRTGVTITATATDSRGASASITTNGATVYGYVPPVVSGNFYRCNSSNTADEQGEYAYGSWSAAVGTSTGSNSIQSIVSTFNNNTSGRISLAQTSSGTYTVTATDKVGGTTRQSFTVASAVYPLQLIDEGSGRVGAAFGGPAAVGRVDSYLKLKEPKGHYVHQAGGRSGEGGYVKVARITITSSYANQPIEFVLGHRHEALFSTVTIQFKNSGDANPGLNSFYSNYTGTAAIQQETTSTWALIVQKTENYDQIEILDFKMGEYMNNRVTVDWINEAIGTTLPTTGMYYHSRPTYSMNVTYADTASNFAGGTISATDGTFSGDVSINGIGTRLPNHVYRNETNYYPQFYDHYYSNPGGTTITTANLRVHTNTANSFATLKFSGDGTFSWNGNEVIDAWNIHNYCKLLVDFASLGSNFYDVTSTTQATIPNGKLHQALVFITRVGTSTYFRHTLVVPVANIPASKQQWYHGWASTEYGGIYLWVSGNNIILQGGAAGAKGNVYQVYGIGGRG